MGADLDVHGVCLSPVLSSQREGSSRMADDPPRLPAGTDAFAIQSGDAYITSVRNPLLKVGRRRPWFQLRTGSTAEEAGHG